MAISDATNYLTLSYISKTPGVIGGDACIRATRIAVWMLVEMKLDGATDKQLIEMYDPPLTEADLRMAWIYWEQNKDEIEKCIREQNQD